MSRYRYWLCAWLLVLVSPGVAWADGVLRVLAWPGYADLDLVKIFEQRTQSKVVVTVIDSDEVLWQKVNTNQAADFDVLAVNTAELRRYIDAGLVVPINTDALPNMARQLPRFRNVKRIAGVTRGNQVFGIPYTYSEMGLIYDRKQIKEPPQSIQALWDPRYQGKVLLYDSSTHNFSLAAQKLGKPSPFDLSKQDWPNAVQQLIALRRNALTFYTQPDESVALFKANGVALMFANYGSQQVKLFQQAGIDIGYAIPREGALAWLDCWAITRGAHNTALAQAWINYFLESEPGNVLLTRQGLSNTTSESPFIKAVDRLQWLQPVEDADRRAQLWARILSGDRVGKVLAP